MTTPLDRFTNLIFTTLTGGINNSSNPVTFTVTSATGFPTTGSYRVLIGNELFQIISGAGTTTWTANRPMEQTGIATHIATDVVTHVVTAFEFNSFRQEYNVVAYGAVGDGVANEVSVFQNAINDAHVTGAPIYIPTATYKLNSSLTTYSNVVFLTSGAIFTGAGAASVAPLINLSLTGTIIGSALSSSGLTGAVAASRYVGATTTGAPLTGTFLVGDWIVTQDGRMWICTITGSPGTWQQPAPPLTFGLASDIAALGASAVAGASGKVADASHVHPWTGLGVLANAQAWAGLQTFNAGIAMGATALTKTRNASDSVPVMAGTNPSGVTIYVQAGAPASPNEGDLWFGG